MRLCSRGECELTAGLFYLMHPHSFLTISKVKRRLDGPIINPQSLRDMACAPVFVPPKLHCRTKIAHSELSVVAALE